MKSRDVPIADIPMAVLDQVENGLRHYFVPILDYGDSALNIHVPRISLA